MARIVQSSFEDTVSPVAQITISQMKDMIRYFVFGMNESLFIRGVFGAGKTAGVDQAVAAIPTWEEIKGEVECIHVLLGQYQDVDLKGTPWVAEMDREGDVPYQMTVWRPASTLPFIGNPMFDANKKYLIFLDEITSANTPVFGVCYQMVHEHRIGEHIFGDNVYIMAAGNRDIDKGIVNKMPLPLLNRFIQAELVVDTDEWLVWAEAEGLPEMIREFFTFRKELLCNYDPKVPMSVVCTPRTAEKMARIYAHPDIPEAIKSAGMMGAVGRAVVLEFETFIDSWSQVARIIPKIKANPSTAFLPDPSDEKSPSLQYAISVALSRGLAKDTSAAYHTYLQRLPEEFCVMAWQMAGKKRPSVMDLPEWVDFTKRYAAVFHP